MTAPITIDDVTVEHWTTLRGVDCAMISVPVRRINPLDWAAEDTDVRRWRLRSTDGVIGLAALEPRIIVDEIDPDGDRDRGVG